MSKLLEVKDLKVSFNTYNGEVHAVRGVTFDLNKGETLAIVGESGSGKSVTSNAIMRLLPEPHGYIKEGQILLEGVDLAKKTSKEMQKIRGKDISMVFQDPMSSLNPTMKIGYQIMEGLMKHQNMSKTEARKTALELLTLVGIPRPDVRINQYPHQFSGGMRQRVVVAIALACNPKILIADEPTTALDVTIQAQILELMKSIQQKTDSAIIFITHDLGVVANVADRVAVMYAGKIVEIGTVDDIFYNPKHPYTWGLIGSMPTLDSSDEELFAIPGSPPNMLTPPVGDAFAPRNQFALEIDTVMEPPMFKVSDTHYAATWLLHPDAPKIEPPDAVKHRMQGFAQTGTKGGGKKVTREKLLEVKNLQKHFAVGKKNTIKAVDGVSFDVFKGETFGLVGESGCGKSTTGRTIIRLYDATGGEVKFNGEDVHGKKNKSQLLKFNRKMQMIFQDPSSSLNPRMTVLDIIAEGLDVHKLVKNEAERKQKVEELLESVGLNKEHATRFPHEFSGGQRQRIGIARALAVDPEFIIADEPISALDVSIQAQVVNLLKKLQKERGLTYLFIAHDLSMVKYISDRIGVMYMGNLVELAESDELYNNPIHPYTKSLLSAIPLPDPRYERARKRISYDPTVHDTNGEFELREVVPGHFVRCTAKELERYQNEQK